MIFDLILNIVAPIAADRYKTVRILLYGILVAGAIAILLWEYGAAK